MHICYVLFIFVNFLVIPDSQLSDKPLRIGFMQFGEHFIEELKARLRPSEVIGRHVKLKRQGREYAALSPFSNEKTPSFFVNDEKGFYHCFSSGKHGDIINFVMEIEGLSFPEAVEKLAGMAGMSLPKADPEAEKRAAHNKKTINIMEQASLFFEKALRLNIGKQARAYLKSRGLTGEDCKKFGIGFAPDSYTALFDELTQMGVSQAQMAEAGLIIIPEEHGKKPWDRFRNRIMFPIHDPRGCLVAFGGRALDETAKAKYLNSPETNIFHKGHVLYHYPQARKALNAPSNGARGLIVAEGYMDVIALAKAGFEHAVAPLGTALTEQQIHLLWRAGPEPVLCFDGDKAGLRAAFRSIERILPLLKPDQTVRFALMPEGQDPDDLIKDKGSVAMEDIIQHSIPLVEMLWQGELSRQSLETPEAKAGLKSRIFQITNDIKNASVKEQYRTALLAKFDKQFGRSSYKSGKNWSGKGSNKYKGHRPDKALQAKMQPDALKLVRERRLIGAVLLWPEMIEAIDQTLFSLKFSSNSCENIQNALLSYWQDTIAVEKRALIAHIEAQGLGKELKSFKREQDLTIAAMGGSGANMKTRINVWQSEAKAMELISVKGEHGASLIREERRGRMADNIRLEQREAILRFMRAKNSNQ